MQVASQKKGDASRCADMATIIQNFAEAHPALCGTINHGSKERGNIRMMNRPFKPEFCTGRLDEREKERGSQSIREHFLTKINILEYNIFSATNIPLQRSGLIAASSKYNI